MGRFAVFLCVIVWLPSAAAWADTVIAKHLIRPRSTVSSVDILITSSSIPNGYSMPEEVIGLEAKTLIYPGRPLGPHNLRMPAVIERNAVVTVHFARKAGDLNRGPRPRPRRHRRIGQCHESGFPNDPHGPRNG